MSDLVSTLQAMMPKPRSRSATPKLTDAEYRAVKAARARGITWKQLHEAVADRFKTPGGLATAYNAWLERQNR